MKSLLTYDISDAPVMLGAASFFGAAAGVVWDMATPMPAPTYLIVSAAIVGMVCGRILSHKAKAHPLAFKPKAHQ